MVDARLEVLITARDQLRGVLRNLDAQISKIRTSIQTVNRQRTDRVSRQLEALRTRAKAVGLDLRGLSTRFLQLNQVRLDRLITQMRGLRSATLGASAAARTLRTALGPFIGVFALVQGLISSVRLIAEFGQQMQVVAAISQATGLEFEELENKARELGATTRFTAQQAAEGLEFLVRAGFSAREATEALEGTLALASAGLIDLGTSASIVSSIVRQFGIDAGEAGDVADILAQTAASSNVNVRQLGESFKFVGPIVASVGSTVEDTAFVLGVLGNAGIQATVAGAGLRRAIGGIVNPTDEAREVINRLLIGRGGIDQLQRTIRAPGGLVRSFELLAEAGLDTGEAFNIFQQRGGLIAIALTRLIGRSGDLVRRFQQLNGAAIRISTQIEDTLLGDFRKLRSAAQELILQLGEAGVTGTLRTVVQGLTSLVRGIIGAEGAVGGLATAGRTIANVYRIWFAILRSTGQFLEGFFAPVVEKLSVTFGKLAGLVEGVTQQFRELGLISTDVSDEVEASFKQIQDSIEAGLFGTGEEAEARLKQFEDDQLTALNRLAQERGRISKEGNASIFTAEGRARRERLAAITADEEKITELIKRVQKQRLTLEKRRIEDTLAEEERAIAKELGLTAGSIEDQIAFLDVRVAAAKTRAKAEAQIFRDQLADLEAIDKQRAAEGLPRLQNFFDQRAELQARASAVEIEAAQRVLALVRQRERLRIDDLRATLDDIEAQIGTVASEQQAELRRREADTRRAIDTALIERDAKIAQAEGELRAAQAKRRAEDNKLILEQIKLQEQTEEFVRAAREELRPTGVVEDFQVILDRITEENQRTLGNIKKDSEDAKIAESFINAQAVDELLAQVEASVRASNERLAREEMDLQRQREQGDIGELERQQAVRDARLAAAEEQRTILAPIRELEALGVELTEQQKIKIGELRTEIKTLGEASLPILNDIQEAFVQSFGRFLEDIISGSKSAKEAFRDFAKDVVAQIQRIIIQQLILNALRGAFGGAPGAAGGGVVAAAQGGLIQFAKGGLQKLAAGGPPVVKGPGTDTSDSVLARLSRGEYVMPAATTRKWLPFLEAMRSGRFAEVMAGKNITLPKITVPKVSRFQQGGLVEPQQTVSSEGEQRGIRLINVVDPSLVRDFITSSEGEQVVFNIIQRNPETVRSLIS